MRLSCALVVVAVARALAPRSALRHGSRSRFESKPRAPGSAVALRRGECRMILPSFFKLLKVSDFFVVGGTAAFVARASYKRRVAASKEGALVNEPVLGELVGARKDRSKGANYQFIVNTPEEAAELKTMCCKKCGFTLYVAKNRFKMHFIDGIKCLSCGAVAPDFYNENNPNDPINFAGATLSMVKALADGSEVFSKDDTVKKGEANAAAVVAKYAAVADGAAFAEDPSLDETYEGDAYADETYEVDAYADEAYEGDEAFDYAYEGEEDEESFVVVPDEGAQAEENFEAEVADEEDSFQLEDAPPLEPRQPTARPAQPAVAAPEKNPRPTPPPAAKADDSDIFADLGI